MLRSAELQAWRGPAWQPARAVTSPTRVPRIAFVLDNLKLAGVQKTTVALAEAVARRGYEVDLVVLEVRGPLAAKITDRVRVVPLVEGSKLWGRLNPLLADPGAFAQLLLPVLLPKRPSPSLRYLGSLVDYLKESRPDALLSATPALNLMSIWARELAKVPVRLLIGERSAPSEKLANARNWRQRYLPPLMRRTYPKADVVVAVSDALAEDLAETVGLQRSLVKTIYNPVVGPNLAIEAQADLDHPWLHPGEPPVILGVGRLTAQKDFPTLLRAFAMVRAQRPARLIILGGGKDDDKSAERQGSLLAMAEELKIAADIDLPGFVRNPYPFMKRASVFVLSSRFEGFGNVLVEALACGCQVVSTDCPTGPAEILANGRYGRLVAMGDLAGMAKAINDALDSPLPPSLMMARAAEFSETRAVDAYLSAVLGGPSMAVPDVVAEVERAAV
ncbi:MAG: glycosyltransferase [Geminicoccaceae bacterium]